MIKTVLAKIRAFLYRALLLLLAMSFSLPGFSAAHEEIVPARQLFGEGLRAEKAGDLSRAANAYLEAIKIYPTYSAAYERLAQLYLKTGDRTQAVRYWTRLAQFEPENAIAHLALGKALELEELWQAAAIQYSLGVKYHPDDPQLNFELGRALIHMGMSDKALEPLKNAAQHNPRDWRVHYLLAEIESQSGHPDSALQQFQLAASANPRAPDFWLDYGCRVAAQGNARRAIGLLQRAIELDPLSRSANLALAQALVSVGDSVAAAKQLSWVLMFYPDDLQAKQLFSVGLNRACSGGPDH